MVAKAQKLIISKLYISLLSGLIQIVYQLLFISGVINFYSLSVTVLIACRKFKAGFLLKYTCSSVVTKLQ